MRITVFAYDPALTAPVCWLKPNEARLMVQTGAIRMLTRRTARYAVAPTPKLVPGMINAAKLGPPMGWVKKSSGVRGTHAKGFMVMQMVNCLESKGASKMTQLSNGWPDRMPKGNA